MRATITGLLLICGLVVLPTCEGAADQGGRLGGIHELPTFVVDRVELTPGVTFDVEPPADAGPVRRTAEEAGGK